MSDVESREGLYSLRNEEIFAEAKELFNRFFVEQTPINAFRLSITLYHLLEWIVPEGNSRKVLTNLRLRIGPKGDDSSLGPEDKLVWRIRNYEFYEVLRSIADNSKHHTLTRSKAYEQGIVKGFRADRSVAGEKLAQDNLVVLYETKEVWLREVFSNVLSMYAVYFQDDSGLYEISE